MNYKVIMEFLGSKGWEVWAEYGDVEEPFWNKERFILKTWKDLEDDLEEFPETRVTLVKV